jgi:hypothetical protein
MTGIVRVIEYSHISRLQATANARYKGKIALLASSRHNSNGFGTTDEQRQFANRPDAMTGTHHQTRE